MIHAHGLEIIKIKQDIEPKIDDDIPMCDQEVFH
jgi:hypothetical protein